MKSIKFFLVLKYRKLICIGRNYNIRISTTKNQSNIVSIAKYQRFATSIKKSLKVLQQVL